MKSVHLSHLNKRTTQFVRNAKLENLLSELEKLLEPVDKAVSSQFVKPQRPPLFLVGSPRGGTTLLIQTINATGQFAVPTNLLARFYYAPYLGAKIQQLLTDKEFDYQGEMSDLALQGEFESYLGKTTGVLSPNEFFHFWRRFLPNYDPQYLSPSEEDQIDGNGLASGIAAIDAVFQKPFSTKASLLQYNLPKLYNIIENGIFLQVRRDQLFVMQSIYEARKVFYDTLDIWWSVKPKEYEELQKLDVYQQIAGQVYFTERALADGLAHIPEKNKLIVEYEYLCENPAGFYTQLKKKYEENGYQLSDTVELPKVFTPSNKIRIPAWEIQKLKESYKTFIENETGIQ